MQKDYQNSQFFDIESFRYKEILQNHTPWQTIAELNAFISKLFSSGNLKPNYLDKKDVFIGKGTIIHPTVEIIGPAIIGENCEIRHAAFLRENCLIGDNVIVGHAIEVKNSILLNKSIINHLCYVGDSIIGNNANISGGAILASFRLDKKNVVVKSDSEMIDTGLEKFGSVVGDESVVGVNAVLNPGTILGKNNQVFPLQSVSGVHADNDVIK